ncbi:hypothetical protein ACFQZT_27690 [Paenibacillus sp. GCM10027628]|uniref:hypothetical protein n=1 Tax=Paenibacillus sp. GCM10027628 TaxID=3273413 RepID=UPI003630315D
MGWWFRKEKTVTHQPETKQPIPAPAPAPAPVPVPNASMQQLELRIKKLEEHLANLTEKRPEIRIDTLHIHQPVLENLTFRLDQLDIKELSGSLNLGNNFGAKPDGKHEAVDAAMKKASQVKENKPATAQESSDNSASGTERTSTGYRYTPQPRQSGGG